MSAATRILDLRRPAREAAATFTAAVAPAGGDDRVRRAAIATWLGRMVNEHESAPVFSALAPQLQAGGASPGLVAECLAMAAEERRHGVLCGAVVEALGGVARAEVPPPAPLPEHLDVSREEAALRNVLSVCCLAETVAVALIGSERLTLPEGPLREVLTRILADEVGHARLGWRWLSERAPALDPEARARLGTYLSVAFGHLERHELERLPLTGAPPPEAEALGVCDGQAARALFYDTLATVVVPGLEAHGLPAARAWAERV